MSSLLRSGQMEQLKRKVLSASAASTLNQTLVHHSRDSTRSCNSFVDGLQRGVDPRVQDVISSLRQDGHHAAGEGPADRIKGEP